MYKFLIESIRALPVVASQAQEFWLAAALSCHQVNICSGDGQQSMDHDIPSVDQLAQVYERCLRGYGKLTALSPPDCNLPHLQQVIREAMKARYDVFHFRSSRLVDVLSSVSVSRETLDLRRQVFEIAQCLAILPYNFLSHWSSHVELTATSLSQIEAHRVLQHLRCSGVPETYESTSLQARQTLVEGYLRYTLRLACNRINRGLEFGDLVQEAAVGLVTAATKFDFIEHRRFALFATTWMWQRIMRALANDSRLIRLPVHAVQHLGEAYKLLRQKRGMSGEVLTAQRLVEEAGLELNTHLSLLEAAAMLICVDAPGPDFTKQDIDLFAGNHYCMLRSDEDLDRRALRKLLREILSDKETSIIESRFGLGSEGDDWDEQTLEQIAEKYDVTRERIRQIQDKALGKLRHPAHKTRLIEMRNALYHAGDTHTLRYFQPRRPVPLYCEDVVEPAHPYAEDHGGHLRAMLHRAFGSRQTFVRQELTIKGQIVAAFGSNGRAMHTSSVLALLRELDPREQHSERSVYSAMFANQEVFLALGAGVFARVDTERQLIARGDYKLPFCPSICGEATLSGEGLESIIAIIDQMPTTFSLQEAITLASRINRPERVAPPWYGQSLAFLFYALGLVQKAELLFLQPMVMSTKGERADYGVMGAALIDRVSGMDTFCGLIQSLQPVTLQVLAAQFSGVYEPGRYDCQNRLSLLRQLGLVKSEHGRFSLSEQGMIVAQTEGVKISPIERGATTRLDHERPMGPIIESAVTNPELPLAGPRGAGILSGCDPEAVDFHEALFERVFIESARLRTTEGWSLMELGLTDADFVLLRSWAQFNMVDFAVLGRRRLQVGHLTITGVEAVALTFLACCSEVGRNSATEGELWPVIHETLNPSLRRQIFVNGYPKLRIKEATETICSRLNIRHVFGREGEQSWLRSVFLQFGLTRSAYVRLSLFLGRVGSPLPVAIEMLLSSTPGIRSASFAQFWQVLQRFRWRDVTARQAHEALLESPWVTATEIDGLLAAILLPDGRSDEAQSGSPHEETSQLIGSPLLTWRDEPRFELPINSECAWLTEKRYALVVGASRRIPLTRDCGKYSIGTPDGRIIVDLSAEVLAVDLQRHQVSCLPGPISIVLAPQDHDFLFYGPGGQLVADSDQYFEPNRPYLLLCRSSCQLSIEVPDDHFRRVFGGGWTLRAYPQGLPAGLEIHLGTFLVWTKPEGGAALRTQLAKPRIVCRGGTWGEQTSVFVEYRDEGAPTHLIVGDNRIQLERVAAHGFRGTINLSANVDYGKTIVRLEYEYNGRLRRIPATLQMGTVNGIAVETEEGWKVFKEGADMDSVYLQSHRIRAQVPSHYDGDPCGGDEWTWMEGDHFCGRPGKTPRAIGHDLHALGESLRLSVGPYNRSFGGQILARSVIHSGLIEWVEKSGDDYQIQFRQAIELGQEHALWVWREGRPAPELVPASAWIQEEDMCFISLADISPIAFAISFQGAWLGSRTCLKGWHGFTELIQKTSVWHETAQWLKWWRVPLFHENLKSAVQARVFEDRTGTLKAWTSTHDLTNVACFSEDHADAWRSVTRHFLWDWRPNGKESAAILGVLDLLTGDLELDSDRDWEGCDELLAIQPLLLIQAASRSLEEMYPDQEREDVQFMLEKLRNRILGVDLFASGSLIEKELARARTAAASALLVDELFISRSLLQEAERQVRGTAEKDRNLRVAIANSQSVRKYLAAAILDKMIRNEVQ